MPGLKLDLAYERIFGNLFVGGLFGSGQGASRSTVVQSGNSLSAGLSYTDNPNWQAQGRFEYRDTAGYDTINVSADLSGKVTSSLTSLISFDRAFASGRGATNYGATTTLRVGMAYRNPKLDRFNALLRYEYRQNPSVIPQSLLVGQGSGSTEQLLATEMIYAPNWRWEFYGKMGVRLSTSYIANDFTAHSTIALAQLRSTYHINRRFDVVGEARWIGQPTANYTELGFLGEVGYHLTPNLRLAAGYSSGSVNSDRDFSGSRSNGGFYAGLTVKLDRLFDGFGLQRSLPAPAEQERIIRAKADTPDNTLQASLPRDIQLNLSQTLNFSNGGEGLTPDSMVVLDSLATLLKEYPDMQVDLQAHLGPLATLKRDSMGLKQMQAARAYLLQQGVNGNQFIIRSIGGEAIADAPIALTLTGNHQSFSALSARLADPTQDLLDKVLPILNGAETASQPTAPTTEPLASSPEVPSTSPATIEAQTPAAETGQPEQPIAGEPVPTQPIAGEPVPTQPIAGEPIPTQPIAISTPGTPALFSLLTLAEKGQLNLNDRLPNALIPTSISLNVLSVPPEPLALAIPSLQDILALALSPPTLPIPPESTPQISLLLETLQDPTLEARRPGTIPTATLSTGIVPPAGDVAQTASPVSPVQLSLEMLPKRLSPSPISLLLLTPGRQATAISQLNLTNPIQLSLAPEAAPVSDLISLLPRLSEALAPLALRPDRSPLGLTAQGPVPTLGSVQTSIQASLPPSSSTPRDRRLTAAVQFLLSKDVSALDTLLEANGLSPLPQIQGQVINLDTF